MTRLKRPKSSVEYVGFQIRPQWDVFSPCLKLLILFLLVVQPAVALEEQRCKTLDIRNSPTMRAYPKGAPKEKDVLNCTVLEGSFLMTMITHTNLTEENFPRFKHLREITGSVLIFQVKGLRSLRWLFPNLRVIGGQTLIQHYSLIVYQNADLEELGLENLHVIRNGGVRITENSKLCNAESIDWKRLQYGPINDVLVDDATQVNVGEGEIAPCENRCAAQLRSLNREEQSALHCHRFNNSVSCWGSSCQQHCTYDRSTNNVSNIGSGCVDETWEKCHEECVGGCLRPNDPEACYACAHVNHEGRCIHECPEHLFLYQSRRCISRQDCHGIPPKSITETRRDHYKAFHGKCDYQCPENYEEDPSDPKTCRKCQGECLEKCSGSGGGITVDSLTRAKSLARCTYIEGYLEIEMRVGMDAIPAEELTKAFSKIRVIDGYLLIRLSTAFINLHMFKSLTTITGSVLYRNKYSVAVYENPNLQKLFPPDAALNISAGFLQFQNNRMLCFRHIENLMESLGRKKEMDDSDQSRNSNGDKAICEESTFEVILDGVSSLSFGLKWKAYNMTDIDYRKFLGYEVLYKEVPRIDLDLSIDDDRSACSDSWNSHFEAVKTSVSDDAQVRVVSDKGSAGPIANSGPDDDYVLTMIANDYIRPNTIYAYYVTTSMVRHDGAKNAISKIGFVKTQFGVPDPPKIVRSEALGTDEIELDWDPPLRPNGEITHYIVSFRPTDIDISKKADGLCEIIELSRSETLPVSEEDGVGSTMAPNAASVLFSTVPTPENTCSAKGCCACPAGTKEKEAMNEHSDFENAVQNLIFVQSADERVLISKRFKRSIDADPSDKDDLFGNFSSLSEEIVHNEMTPVKPLRIRVNTTSIRLKHLKHFTDYFISVVACQNESAPFHQCSQKKAWTHVTTLPIEEEDVVDNTTIGTEVIINGTLSLVNITWKAPESPNGAVLGYRIKVVNVDQQATPLENCLNVLSFSPELGYIIKGLTDGEYRVEIRTISMWGISVPSVSEYLFTVKFPGFWTLQRILISVSSFLVFLAIVGLLIFYFGKKYYGQKVKEYATQLISANPEYLSQNDVYKADHWEVDRSQLTMLEEIGKGTFGKVYRGYGHHVTSVCGEVFGSCAIKTVTEGATSAERLHFLMEASVMKQFNSSFIVKLYGVVSDGQPVLVIMEMMEKGNLRDYLRSTRKGAEENVEDLPQPTEDQFYEWAAQIADGMSYLESIRFCHRDLAARNCMVHADETVKIGDFGMARDLYYHEYYKPTGKRLMPVRWMAPESLKDGRFDSKSDVWAYGIVLYEMWTLGQQPYMGLGNEEVLNFIGMQRKILDRPADPLDCPDFWYNLMKECWKYQPKDRPSFHQIVRELLDFTSDNFRELSFVVAHPELGVMGSDEESAYVLDGHGIRNFDIAENEGMFITKNNRAAHDEPSWNEKDSLADDSLAEHEL